MATAIFKDPRDRILKFDKSLEPRPHSFFFLRLDPCAYNTSSGKITYVSY